MRNRTQSGGFTLIELMIVVAIVAILAAIAYPSYQDSVRKSRRADAKVPLLDAVQRQERFFTVNNQYTGVLVGPSGCTGAACGLNLSSTTTTDGYYTLSVTTTTTSGRVVAYNLTATPVAGKSQAQDSSCGALAVNNTGVKCILGGTKCSNVAADQEAVRRCW